ncbi:MAG: leucine-rich repeat-containing protein kinase family protein [Leptothrix ochracea]|uniref:leucine-rich repeat-containing protein kinase family protein n=1 Tax=Leptothrix ochracea TaxID=735331 RepID=UPI0034E19B2F
MHTLSQLRSGALAGTRRLDLSADLTVFPPEIFDLADTLEVLNLSGNRLSTLPDDLPRLKKLKVIFCSDNDFSALPAVLGACERLEMVGFKANHIRVVPPAALPARLRWLILTDNRLAELPLELGRCQRLQKLMLAGNRLQTLPDLSNCERLELLRLAANRIEVLPPWLSALPRLSWVALAGNPLWQAEVQRHDARHDRPDLARIPGSALALEHTLGEGASGVIHRALWRRGPDQAPQPVAVKLFRAAMTSDGSPDSEMAACVAAAGHPGLIPVEGLLKGPIPGHRQDGAGLVLALLDPAFRALAGPPSLSSCTRDVYADALHLSTASVLGLARRMADVVAHLHARGLMHGDLYAHNILWDGAAGHEALLSDFGAATFYDRTAPDAGALERLEVRAFGCLLEEWLDHAVDPADALLAPLATLRDACLQPEVLARPSFAEIVALWHAI